MSTIDLRQGSTDYEVTTSVKRDGVAYMGPTVLVTARDEEHARQIANENGHTVNEYFPPKRVGRK